jgi:glycosyltransferase involved in cell wall biosynthesis
MPFISICIPAYKHPDFMERLLDSIARQRFQDYEVIVSDDTPGYEVKAICERFTGKLPLTYLHNDPPFGSPANWNNAIRHAKGEWIKLIHDDDWLNGDDALQQFADAARRNLTAGFIFSGYSKWEGKKCVGSKIPGKKEAHRLSHSSIDLIAENFIGHPSVTMIRNRNQEWYDERVKWVVDFEFYIRELKHSIPVAISKILVNIGVHDQQVTQLSIRKPEIEIPEHLYLLEKLGPGILNNVWVYDHYWRLFRNLKFKHINEVAAYAGNLEMPSTLISMWNLESRFPNWLLRIGPASKLLMYLSYTFNR